MSQWWLYTSLSGVETFLSSTTSAWNSWIANPLPTGIKSFVV